MIFSTRLLISKTRKEPKVNLKTRAREERSYCSTIECRMEGSYVHRFPPCLQGFVVWCIRWGMGWSTLQCPKASSPMPKLPKAPKFSQVPWLFDVLWFRCTLQPNSRLNVQQSDWRQRPKADGRSSDGRVCEMRGDNNARVLFLKFWLGLRLCLIVSWFAIG